MFEYFIPILFIFSLWFFIHQLKMLQNVSEYDN